MDSGNGNPACTRRSYLLEGLQFGWRPFNHKLGEVNVGNFVTSLRFVHVMCCYKQSFAHSGQIEKQVPEFASGNRIDSSRRLIEKDKIGFVDKGGGEREPLFPPA